MKCESCNGSGRISISRTHSSNPNLDWWESYVCTECGGKGKIIPTVKIEEPEEKDYPLDLITAIWGVLDSVNGSEGWVYDLVDNGIKSWKAARRQKQNG